MKRIMYFGAVVALLIIGWTGLWLFAAGQIRTQADLLATPNNPYGVTLACADLAITGFPFRFDATCSTATLQDGDIGIEIAEIKATALVYRPTHFLLFAQAPLVYTDAFFGTRQQLNWSLLEASIRLDGTSLSRISLHAENLDYADMLVGRIQLGSATQFEAHLAPLGDTGTKAGDGLALYLVGDTINFAPLSVTNGRLTVEAELHEFPTDTARWIDPDLFVNWQARNGRLTLNRLEADDAAASLSAAGDIWVSPTGYPEADLRAQSSGVAEKFAGAIDEQSMTMFFGAPDAIGTRTQILTVRDGTILVGLVPSGRLPPLF